MKNLKKVLAIFLTALFVLSATTVLAGAVNTERENLTRHSSKNDIDAYRDFKITKVFKLGEEEYLPVDKILRYVDTKDAVYSVYSAYQKADVCDEDGTVIGFDSSITCNCIDIIIVDAYVTEPAPDGEGYIVNWYTQYFLLVVNNDGEDMGKVTGVSVSDVTFDYKSDDAWLYNWVDTATDDGAYWIEFYVMDDYNGPYVYPYGQVDTTSTGKSQVTCYVIDANGNVFTDRCTVTVKLTFLQWIIKYLCFGWLWGF